MKTVLFVPGFRDDINTHNYRNVLKVIQQAGYKVKFVPIKWNRTTVFDWIKELEQEYSKLDPKETVLAGFSFGAVTAFMAATKTNPAQLWLFSFAPAFSKDMKKRSKSWFHDVGAARVKAFRTLDFNKLAQKVKCPTLILVGEKEARLYPPIGEHAKFSHKKIPQSRLIEIPDTDHDVTEKNYIEVIKKSI